MVTISRHIKEEIKEYLREIEKIKEFSALTPPSIIISSHSYPKANAYVLFPLANNQELVHIMENYSALSNLGDYYHVIHIRMRILGMRKSINLKNTDKLEDLRLLGMGEREEDVESRVDKVYLPFSLKSNLYAPFLPVMRVQSLKYGNVKINKHVEKVYYDTDWKANEALLYLYKKGIDEYKLSRFFSLGVMGTKIQRKLVPTKWSITAVDDIIYKHIIEDIKSFPSLSSPLYYTSHLYMNTYHIFLLPGTWEYELIEFCYGPRAVNHDYEGWWGRKQYASETTGAYYAIRKIIAEHLKSKKVQAKVLVIREIEKNYRSLGVWVVREGIRKAIMQPPLSLTSSQITEIINKINKTASLRLSRNIKLEKMSRVLRAKNQRKLYDL